MHSIQRLLVRLLLRVMSIADRSASAGVLAKWLRKRRVELIVVRRHRAVERLPASAAAVLDAVRSELLGGDDGRFLLLEQLHLLHQVDRRDAHLRAQRQRVGAVSQQRLDQIVEAERGDVVQQREALLVGRLHALRTGADADADDVDHRLPHERRQVARVQRRQEQPVRRLCLCLRQVLGPRQIVLQQLLEEEKHKT